MEQLERATALFSSFMWDYPLLILLLGGGIYFLVYSRLAPFRYFKHAVQVALGKYNNPAEPGQISSFQALSTALSATIGMGNISGVAIAIATGGPGAIFWMWVSAIVGMATEFFTCSLAVMYRSKDKNGKIHGGPMYVIMEGLGKKWKPLAIMFSLSGMIGVLPVFQVNQYTQAVRDIVLPDLGIQGSFTTNLITAFIIILLSILVIFGGIKRIGKVAGSLVPFMTILYSGAVMYILFNHASDIIPTFQLIFSDAFTGKSVAGGTLGSLIILGVKRGTFSSEAGLGTAPMAHGAAKTSEPIRQGLVAMLGPSWIHYHMYHDCISIDNYRRMERKQQQRRDAYSRGFRTGNTRLRTLHSHYLHHCVLTHYAFCIPVLRCKMFCLCIRTEIRALL
jgi:alanine or glycine:cation symporter, AGCS family